MGDTTIEVIVIDDHRVVGLGVKAAFENRGVDASISWAPTVRDAKRLRGQVAILDLRLADGSDPDRNIADLNGRAIPVDLVEAVLAAADGATFPTPDWAAALDADEDFVADHLSDLEARILTHYASGASSACVARTLSVSKNTVNTYIARIRDRYREAGRHADSRVDLFRRAAEDGLVSYFE